jgi:PIN domain nuclease of toxin-antitoxin system
MGCKPLIVLDTHVLIWWLSDSASLSPKARRLIAKESSRKSIVVSTISALEITTLVRRARLRLAVPVDSWLADARCLPELRFEVVSFEIAQLAGGFGEEIPGDPADRIIAATATVLNAPLVTADAKLRAYKPLATVW